MPTVPHAQWEKELLSLERAAGGMGSLEKKCQKGKVKKLRKEYTYNEWLSGTMETFTEEANGLEVWD